MFNKIAVSELPPFMLAGIRFVSASILIFGIAKLLGFSLKISKQQFYNTLLVGFLFLTIGNGLAVWALKYIDSGFAALIISAQPLLVLLLMLVLEGKRIKMMSIIGIILGFIGIYLLVSQEEIVTTENSYVGILMIFICMLCWGYGSLYVAKSDLPKNFFVNTAYQMFTGGILLFIGSLLLGETWSYPTTWSNKTTGAMLFLIVFGGIIAFTSFNYLLKIVSPEKVATSTYVNPIIAMFLGWYFLNETITTQSIIAAVILLTGVYFINTNKKIALFSRFRTKKI